LITGSVNKVASQATLESFGSCIIGMMPGNSPPPHDDKLTPNDHATYHQSDVYSTQNLLRHLMQTRQSQLGRQYEIHQRDTQRSTEGAMVSTLNENMPSFFFQQHAPLHQQHEPAIILQEGGSSHRDMVAHLADLSQQAHLQDTSASQGSAMHFHGLNLQQNSLGQYSNRFNPTQAPIDDEALNMLLAANIRNTPPSFTNMMNVTDQGESNAMHDTGMLRAYNQSIRTHAFVSSANHAQQQNFGEVLSMGPTFLDSHSHLSGVRQSMNNPSMHQATSQAGPNRGIMQNTHFSEGIFQGEMPDRIEPRGMGNSLLGHGMIDIPFGIQQQRLHELRVGEKRPYGADGPKEPKPKRKRGQRKKPADMPRRALSAYNLFFSAERQRILKEIAAQESGGATVDPEKFDDGEHVEGCQALQRPLFPSQVTRRPHRKTHGKIGFQTLAQTVGRRWKELSVEQKSYYQELADQDMTRQKDAMEEYYKMQAEEKAVSVADDEEKGKDVNDKVTSDLDDEGSDAEKEEAPFDT
jgi:hypothetical protein